MTSTAVDEARLFGEEAAASAATCSGVVCSIVLLVFLGFRALFNDDSKDSEAPLREKGDALERRRVRESLGAERERERRSRC